MKKKDIKNRKPMIKNTEIEVETNDDIDIKDTEKNKVGVVNYPNVEDEVGFKTDIAQQAGQFTDQVLVDSPAAEANLLGQDNLKKIIKDSKKKIAKKIKALNFKINFKIKGFF